MATYIITGCGGFVAQHYLNILARGHRKTVVAGIGRRPPNVIPTNVKFQFHPIDLTNVREINGAKKKIARIMTVIREREIVENS